jgi:hypothetical protein
MRGAKIVFPGDGRPVEGTATVWFGRKNMEQHELPGLLDAESQPPWRRCWLERDVYAALPKLRSKFRRHDEWNSLLATTQRKQG